MGRRLTAALAATLLALLALAGTQRPAPLTAKQQEVLDYLVANWGKDTAVTGIDLAMQILGGDYTPEDRYALATYIRDHPEIHRVIRVFGWVPVALTPEEKLIARQLSRAEREKRPAPTSVELARSVGVGPKAIPSGLQMLERLGIIRPDPEAGGVGYRMANERYVTWEGMMKIDFMYHRVQIEGQQPLDTYWALDFIALVNAKWRNKRVTVEDSSQYSSQRIHLVFENGRVKKLEPATTRIFLGGGWGINNLFSSEEEIKKWLEGHPELKGRPIMTVQELLDRLSRGERLPL